MPRDAATVIPLREDGGGLAVYCVVRHPRSSFLGGALVFPGGKVDASDGEDGWDAAATAPPERTRTMVDDGSATRARALSVAACRESLEEAAIVPLVGAADAEELERMRAELAADASLSMVLARRGLRLALDTLIPFARWITPEAESRRFDARFFLLRLPPGQLGAHDHRETTHGLWATARELLDRAARGEFFLAPPTLRTLELLAPLRTVDEAIALAERQSLRPICPSFVPGSDDAPPALTLPGDPTHPVGERRVDGPTRFVLRDGRFVSEDAPSRGTG